MVCDNCSVLESQVEKLRSEVDELQKAFIDFCEKSLNTSKTVRTSDGSCQTDEVVTDVVTGVSIISNESLKASHPIDVSDGSCQTDLNATDELFSIFMDSAKGNNSTQSKSVQLNKPPTVLPPTASIPSYSIKFQGPFKVYHDTPLASFSPELLLCDTSFASLSNRSVCYYGSYGYSYGNVKHLPNPIPANNYLTPILERLHAMFPNYEYNSVLVTLYADGTQSLPYHSDDEPEIAAGSTILTISLGSTRNMLFKNSSSGAVMEATLEHGSVTLMSQDHQSRYKHSIPANSSTDMRISITCRLIEPELSSQDIVDTLVGLSSAPSPPTKQHAPQKALPSETTTNLQASQTLYISSSMFSGLNAIKLSSKRQKATRFSYPSATAQDILSKLQHDPKFHSVNKATVKQIFLLCGTCDIDKTLRVPSREKQNILSPIQPDVDLIDYAKSCINSLIGFLHECCPFATINVLNILPRASLVRNLVINELNSYITEIAKTYSFVNMIDTESKRNLFSSKDGFRKNDFFSRNGDDNVHLNRFGVSRLANYLKYTAHQLAY